MFCFSVSAAHGEETQVLIANGQWRQLADSLYQQALEVGSAKAMTVASMARYGRYEQALALAREGSFPVTQLRVVQVADDVPQAQRLEVVSGIKCDDGYQTNIQLASTYLTLNRQDQAVEVYKRMLQRGRDQPLLVRMLAGEIRETDDLQVMRAMAPLLEVAAKDLSNDWHAAGTMAHLAYVYARLGQMERAENALRAAYKTASWGDRERIRPEIVEAALTIGRPDLAEKYDGNADYSWMNYKVRQGDYLGAMQRAERVPDNVEAAVQHVENYAVRHGATSPNLPALVSFLESFKAKRSISYTVGQLVLAGVYAERGEAALAHEALRRGADSLPKDGTETGADHIQAAVKLGLTARKLGFDDLSRSLTSRVPGMLATLQGDAKGHVQAWLNASYMFYHVDDEVAAREDFARAYQAMSTLPKGKDGGSRYEASRTRVELLLSMAQVAQTMADGDKPESL